MLFPRFLPSGKWIYENVYKQKFEISMLLLIYRKTSNGKAEHYVHKNFLSYEQLNCFINKYNLIKRGIHIFQIKENDYTS